MSFFNVLTQGLRSRSTVPANGTVGSAADTAYAATATGALPSDLSATAEAQEPSSQEKQLMLHLSNVSHGVNHFQNQMMTMLYPSIMAELGLNYMQVGVLSAICSVLNSLCQGAYGFITPFLSRCKLLGFGNLGIALGTLLSGLAGSYPVGWPLSVPVLSTRWATVCSPAISRKTVVR